jgi:hypothetical protein
MQPYSDYDIRFCSEIHRITTYGQFCAVCNRIIRLHTAQIPEVRSYLYIVETTDLLIPCRF